jgi:hypothetical protein
MLCKKCHKEIVMTPSGCWYHFNKIDNKLYSRCNLKCDNIFDYRIPLAEPDYRKLKLKRILNEG